MAPRRDDARDGGCHANFTRKRKDGSSIAQSSRPTPSLDPLETQTPASDSENERELEALMAKCHAGLRQHVDPRSTTKPDNASTGNRGNLKLAKLLARQFHELSNDVYEDAMRRADQLRPGSTAPGSLPYRDHFHERRNQARQKMGTLPDHRFRVLALEVFLEIERRYPHLANSNNGGRSSNGKLALVESRFQNMRCHDREE